MYEEKYLEEVLGALLANATSGREFARDCKALDLWGTGAQRSDHREQQKRLCIPPTGYAQATHWQNK